ncbi:MAG TPA: glycosyltransferase [Opitutaceae bacterium]|nr:glycosyltransferase [Opitutaceae bacterium]
MLLIDLTHTSHTPANTGIQRLARSLCAALERRTAVAPVCLDPFADAWRPLDALELRLARGEEPVGRHRGSRWTLGQKARGWTLRFLRKVPPLPAASGLVCPELFSPAVAVRFAELAANVAGPRIGFFFDAIPLTHPEYTPPKTVARFPGFMQELLQFDGVAAISQTSADYLSGYWSWLGVTKTPAVTVVPLGVDLPQTAPRTARPPATSAPQVLCVSSIEGRKNHLALLAAAESLWAAGVQFELRLVGLPRPETAAAALREIERLRAAGRALRFDGVLDEPALEQAWADCTFSVYPSMIEGFGLPVIESLVRGKPCVCAATGATGELIPGGGCLGVTTPDADGFAAALRRLLTEPELLPRLRAEGCARKIATWDDSAAHLLSWMAELASRE